MSCPGGFIVVRFLSMTSFVQFYDTAFIFPRLVCVKKIGVVN